MAVRISGIMDGRLTALSPEPPELSSDGGDWSGFLLEAHRVGPSREEVDWSWHSTHVGVCLDGEAALSVSGDLGDYRYSMRPGDITLFPGGRGRVTIRQHAGRCQVAVVELDGARLARLLPEPGEARRAAALTPLIDARDPQLAALLRAMYLDVAAGSPSGPLYGQSLSLALLCYLTNRYGAAPLATPRDAGLSPRQRDRALAYIQSQLDAGDAGELHLDELARLVALSPRHFLRLFRHSFGVTPHRYLTDRRIERARALLAGNDRPIVDIALALGFKTQSHFTEVFRRRTGLTPARYRRLC